MRKILLGIILVLSFHAKAQDTERKLEVVPDIHFRMFWMSTSYPSDFKDDYALGTSLQLGGKFTYAKHWDLQVGYRFYGDLWSSDIWSPDPVSGNSNRYETGLFDLQNPGDRFFGRLESLSISYSTSLWGVRLGRMGINTDWINAQDGRLSPTAVEGVHGWYSPAEKWKIGAWGITRMGVRGTSKWLGIGESIGVYPLGRDVFGQPSQYKGNTQSDWIGVLEVSYDMEKLGKLNFSETLVQNISNTIYGSLEKEWGKEAKSEKWISALQLGFQNGIGAGGNEDVTMRYKDPNDKNWVISGRVRYERNQWKMNLSYTHVGGKGRWLSPREWGKDAWYTFIPRERNEGYETVDALVFNTSYQFSSIGLTPYLFFGLHWLPEIQDVAANKYAFPSYRQINFGLRYRPKGIRNLDAHFILMNKEALGNSTLSPGQRYNKVGMIHTNVMINWRPFQ